MKDNLFKSLLPLILAFSGSALADPTSPLVIGLRKAFATAYQSCQSLRLPPMTQSTPPVQGVVETGHYPGSWNESYRKISDQEALNRSHYYIKDYVATPGCIDVKKHSMIYNYGGKPFTTSADDSSLNYWQHGEEGSPGLGVDCSGFVFSSIASAGLRLIAGTHLKADEVNDYPAEAYYDFQGSGFSCLGDVDMGIAGSLKPGDILASKYHIALVAEVGADPLALHKYHDCQQITFKDFDFVIAQSSPDQNAIGINKYEAREYLAPFLHFVFRTGLEQYARQACEALHTGVNTQTTNASLRVSRHNLAKECLQAPIRLEGESCIAACPELGTGFQIRVTPQQLN